MEIKDRITSPGYARVVSARRLISPVPVSGAGLAAASAVADTEKRLVQRIVRRHLIHRRI